MIRYQIIIMRVISNESKGTILLYGLIDGVGATDSLVRVGFVFLRRRLVPTVVIMVCSRYFAKAKATKSAFRTKSSSWRPNP